MRRRPENGDEMHNNNAFGSERRGASRNYNGGGGYYSAPTDRIRETNHNIMEMQNNAHIDDLSDQVNTADIDKVNNFCYLLTQRSQARRACPCAFGLFNVQTEFLQSSEQILFSMNVGQSY